MRIIGAILTLAGGALMIYTTIKYNKLLNTMRAENLRLNKRERFVMAVTRLICIFFVIGFFVGGSDIFRRDVEPIFYFVIIVFFVGAVFIYLLVRAQGSMVEALRDNNGKLQQAVAEIEQRNQSLESEVEERVREIMRQDRLLHIVNDAASLLLSSDVDEFDASLFKSMGMMANSAAVDRVYIWKNHERDGKLRCTQVYEWSEEAEAQQGNELTVDIAYEENIPGWEEKFREGRSVNGPVRTLSKAEQEQLVPQQIVSILVVPVYLQDKLWGFVGFDDCRNERYFSEMEESILRSASLLIANALLRNEMTQHIIQARKEAESNAKAKSEFLSNMSHEIRTPINAITGMATIARGTEDVRRIYDCLDKIDAASRQLLGLINDVLDMSKIEAGKLELANEPFALLTAIENVKNIMDVQAKLKQQDLVLRIDPDVPQAVVGDEMRLSQVLINLLSNAIKFTPEKGRIDLQAHCTARSMDRCEIAIEVRDTGIGISGEQQSRLFHAFEQADRNTASQFGGTGLGLAISGNIAQLMGGGITVQSEQGQGSCFTVRVQLESGSPEMLPGKREHASQVMDFSGRTALLVEDIPLNREIVVALLEDTRLQIDYAENGREALEMFKADPDRYDIIYMDIHMPVMNGYEAVERLRGLPVRRAKTVPILAMTANAFSEDVEKCLRAGMNDHIAKPIEMEILLQKTSQHLKRSEAEKNRRG